METPARKHERRAVARGGRALVVATIVSLAACALGPDYHPPQAPGGDRILPETAAQTIAAPGGAQRFDREADVPAQWWSDLGSEKLDAVVAQALADSPTLASARAALRESENALRAGYGVFYPQVGASVSAGRQQSVLVPAGAPVAVGPYSLSTEAATVTYVPDLFGVNRRTVEALGAGAQMQRYAVLAAYLTLTSNLVNAEIADAGYRAQRDALQEVIVMQGDQVRIARVQFDAGTGAYGAVVALQSQQATNVAGVAALDQRIDQCAHLIAQLTGRPPSQAPAGRVALEDLRLPARLPDALPSALARRRPDILAAEADVHRASAMIGVATGDMFPTMTLGGALGATHGAIEGIVRSGVTTWSTQTQLEGSVFSGFGSWYERKAAIDAYQQALADYQQTVLAALEQVADAMTALSHDAQALQAQADALDSAQEGLRLARTNYEAGTAGYLDLLNANTQYQQARLSYLGALAQRFQDTVALFAALGGGWWNGAPEAPKKSLAP